jgi:hypothetical protein
MRDGGRGLTGPPVVASLETHWNRASDYYAVPWRGTWKGEAGGAILGHAIHAHDLLCRYFGPVAQCAGAAWHAGEPIETEDCAAISMGFENGALATSSVTLGAARDETRLRFVFRDLTATSGTEPYAPAMGRWRFEARRTASRIASTLSSPPMPVHRPALPGTSAAVADHIEDNKVAPPCCSSDGRASIELVTAIYTRPAAVAVSLPLTAGPSAVAGLGAGGPDMRETWRWFGPPDPITLAEVRQTGAVGIVSALHHVPSGVAWVRRRSRPARQRSRRRADLGRDREHPGVGGDQDAQGAMAGAYRGVDRQPARGGRGRRDRG